MITIKDGIYFSRFFYVPFKSRNIMGALIREKPDGPFLVTFRFRNFKDEKVFESDDTRSWYRLDMPTEVEGLAAMYALLNALKTADAMDPDGMGPAEVVVVESDRMLIVLEVLGAQEWAHLEKEMSGR